MVSLVVVEGDKFPDGCFELPREVVVLELDPVGTTVVIADEHEGPVSIVLSTVDRKAYVYRKGVEIGSAEVEIRGTDPFLHEGIFTVLEGFGDRESPLIAGKPDHRWMSVAATSDSLLAFEEEAELSSRVHIAPFFAAQLYEALIPGSTLVITNREAAPHTRSASDFVVMAAHLDSEPEVVSD